MKPLIRLLVMLSCLVVPAGATYAAPIKLVASFSILADVAGAVGGEHVTVSMLVGPDQDAHVYQPRPSDVVRLGEADLVVINGLGFEGWITRLIQAAGFRGRVVVASDGVTTLALDHQHRHETSDAHSHHGHAHPAHAPDPHVWQNPLNVAVFARNIAAALRAIDPLNADSYARNAEAYISSLNALDAWVREAIGSVPIERRKVMTSHAAMAYYGNRYQVRFLAPQGVTTASEPAARDVAALIRQIRNERVSALFLESIVNSTLLEQIASEAGTKLGGRLYSDALSGKDGPAPTYVDLMRHNTRLLVDAMRVVD